ncbi:hypothetical protein PVT67_00495 [Gallaecimonas kandeliae]|nr:hypothetical protein [Gallaecimonas kandeliae]WKE65770.1 hypothetical protein PVT67_00495 [Gallaecimonas kandeliae]
MFIKMLSKVYLGLLEVQGYRLPTAVASKAVKEKQGHGQAPQPCCKGCC